jgi:hypothetical protein
VAIDRKAAARAYREERRPMGVFAVRNTVTGTTFLGATVDLPSMLRRQLFTLQMGSHADHALQAEWNEHGEPAFVIEIIDVLEPPEDPAYKPADDLEALLEIWRERLAQGRPDGA